MGDPPRVRASCTVQAETWTRLPDDGFEILHSYPGNQAIGAHPLRVQIRRLGPEIPTDAPVGGVFTLTSDGRTTRPIPYNATEEQRREAERDLEPLPPEVLGTPLTVQTEMPGVAPRFRSEESAEQQCSYCEATDRVLSMARIVDDAEVPIELFDALVKVAEMVSKRNPLGRKLAMTILGNEQ